MKFNKTAAYVSACKKAKISAQDENRLLDELAKNPTKGDVIPNSGGFRKVRMAINGRGKRGGARVIYMYVITTTENDDDIVYLVMIYAKNEKTNLTADELKILRALAKEMNQ